MQKTRVLSFCGIAIALGVILSRFLSINTPIVQISFSFVPIIIVAEVLGWKYSTIVAGLIDLIGALLFPFGTYFFGFTISAVLSGFIYGICLYHKSEWSSKKLLLMTLIACLTIDFLVHAILNTIWLRIMYNKYFDLLLPIRYLKQLLILPFQIFMAIICDRMIKDKIRLK